MEVEYTAAFLQQLRRLGHRYPHIRDDVQPVIEQLQAGEILGEQIPRTGLTLFKGQRKGVRHDFFPRFANSFQRQYRVRPLFPSNQ